MKHLLSHLGRPLPVSPFALFNLTRSGFLNSMALIVTYLIVLLQFKDSATG